jgi:hypothetical protein
MSEIERFFDYPQVSITPTSVTCYTRVLDTFTGRFYRGLMFNPLPEDNHHHGKFSKKSISRIYKRIFTYIYNVDKNILVSGSGREKIGFLTLTLPSSQVKRINDKVSPVSGNFVTWYHSDTEIKSKCLNQFFIELRKNYGITERIWKGEKQKNGSIHFHILIDKFIPHEDIRDRWNRIINKLGYVDRYAAEMRKLSKAEYIALRLQNVPNIKENQAKRKKMSVKAGENFDKMSKEGWRNPNSVDIHSLYKNKKGKDIGNVVAYIAKYMSKSDNDAKEFGFDMSFVTGRIWYCSRLVSRACRCVVDGSSDILDALSEVRKKINDVYVIEDEYFNCYCFSIVQALKKGVGLFDEFFEQNLIKERSLCYG